jgi:putrescine transport system substrate-binding protein
VLETKLLAGRSGYDVVVPTAPFLERQIKAGVFLPLDKSKLPNLKNMDPDIMQRTAAHDPGNNHSINYLWGTVGLGYNPDLVKKAIGTDTIDSWAALLDPAIASKLGKCGIAILDAPTDVFGSVAIYRNLDPNSEKPEDLKVVEDTLMKIRPYVRYFHSSQYINDLASGEICLALGWSGDVLQARDRGAAAAKPVRVKYVIPKEGAINFFDMLAIPADAPHPENAHAFLNYLMEPEVIAKVSNKVRYANGNIASLPFIEDTIKNDPGIYPDAATRARLQPDLVESQQFSRELNRSWTRVRSGQ